MSEERLERIEEQLAALSSDVVRKSDLADLFADVAHKGDIEALRNQMLVLHEDVIERIAALAPDFTPIRREFREADAHLREDIERRLEPLEASVRSRRRRQ